MRVTASTENYMEAILMLQQHQADVHAVDLANHFGFSRPTISQYLKRYERDGLVNIDANSHITLTPRGREIAENTLERHHVISAFFISLGVPEHIAIEDACRVEHDLSPETFDALRRHLG